MLATAQNDDMPKDHGTLVPPMSCDYPHLKMNGYLGRVINHQLGKINIIATAQYIVQPHNSQPNRDMKGCSKKSPTAWAGEDSCGSCSEWKRLAFPSPVINQPERQHVPP